VRPSKLASILFSSSLSKSVSTHKIAQSGLLPNPNILEVSTKWKVLVDFQQPPFYSDLKELKPHLKSLLKKSWLSLLFFGFSSFYFTTIKNSIDLDKGSTKFLILPDCILPTIDTKLIKAKSTTETKIRIIFSLNWIEGSGLPLSRVWTSRYMIAGLAHNWFPAYV
jgi:hypothetical protein